MNGPNTDIVESCKSLINAEFYGETSSRYSKKKDVNYKTHTLNIGLYLRAVDHFLNSFGDINEISGDEDDLITYLRYIAGERKGINESVEMCFERLLKDKDEFLKLYKARGGHSQTINKNILFWGSRQQFRAGKVVADLVDPDYGPLDPIYGILLNPTGGLLGRGEESILHTLFYDNNGVMAYHAATHDSFGYLLRFHDRGPGYDYASSRHICPTSNPLIGQFTGLWFWMRLLRNREYTYVECF